MSDYVEFEDYSMEVLNAIDDAVSSFLEEAGALVESQTKRNTRIGTHQTKDNWDHIVDEGKKIVTIGNPLENAIWEEFGTGDYAINGDGAPTPWYVPVSTYIGKKKPTFNGKVVIVYGKNKTAFYKTNGKKPTRAFQHAIDSCKNKINARAQKIFGSKLS